MVSLSGDRMEAEQAAVLFKNVAIAVLAASGGAVMLAAQLARAGVLDGMKGALWALSIVSCALVHLGLRHLYLASPTRDLNARRWMQLFTAVSLAEGVGWGWATLWLVGSPHLEAQLLVMAVAISVASASIPAFSPYLPALYCFFIPTTAPCAVASLISDSPLRQIIGPMLLLFIATVSTLGFMASRNFKAFVHLRFQAADLAANLHVQKEIADKANLAKSSFLAAASHDLRQPVHALTLFIGALRSVAMPDEGRRLVEQIEASAGAMDMLFGALLDISRLDAGVVEVRPQSFALQPLLDRLLRDHRQEAAAKGLELVCQPTSAVVETDPVLVERILRNLISNALRYTQQGRVLVGCRRSSVFRVEVWDTGQGIAPNHQTQVFEEYFQLENPERDRTKGLGLGLAIVKRLSALLGSELRLRSRVGRGSCFSITLPRGRIPRHAPRPDRRGVRGRRERPVDCGDRRRERHPRRHVGAPDRLGTRGGDGRLGRGDGGPSKRRDRPPGPCDLRLPPARRRDRRAGGRGFARKVRRRPARLADHRRHRAGPLGGGAGERPAAAAQAGAQRQAPRGHLQPPAPGEAGRRAQSGPDLIRSGRRNGRRWRPGCGSSHAAP